MSGEKTMTTHVMGRVKQETSVYCPTGVAVTKKYIDISPRVDTLDGRRVGLLWNGKPNGDVFLNRVSELLEKNYKSIEIIKFWEVDPEGTAFSNKYSDEILDRIANSADIVIASQAD
jgi:hypothetical protein